MWYVYILLCTDGTLYTGISNDLEKRFFDHQNGRGGRYTRSHKPVKIVYKEQLSNRPCALRRENEIKKMSRQEKLQILRQNGEV